MIFVILELRLFILSLSFSLLYAPYRGCGLPGCGHILLSVVCLPSGGKTVLLPCAYRTNHSFLYLFYIHCTSVSHTDSSFQRNGVLWTVKTASTTKKSKQKKQKNDTKTHLSLSVKLRKQTAAERTGTTGQQMQKCLHFCQAR